MDIQSLYNKRFDNSKILERKNKIWQVLCHSFFQKYIPEGSTVLDIASGYCEFINNIKAGEKIAFDLNPDTKLHAAKDVQVVEDSFFNMEAHLQGKKVDIIFASNIFEHLDTKDQVVLAIKKSAEALNPKGRLIILQPDIRHTGAAYWDFIDHKVALTGEALIEAGEMCGLKVACQIRKFLPYTTKSKLPQHPFLIWLYLKLMPLSGFFMGQQTFLILEK
jgi:2-polyprenyl-3-methyl-5-hydroxy-6-metoxy-1,4-benzoquinol methylase